MQCRFVFVVMLSLTIFITLQSSVSARSDSRVKGYQKKNGKTVSPHRRKPPNKSRLDNYGTKGMVNPHSGKVGEKDPFAGNAERGKNGNP